ncbi:unnamed protein product [Brassica rapa subsp. narinosa]
MIQIFGPNNFEEKKKSKILKFLGLCRIHSRDCVSPDLSCSCRRLRYEEASLGRRSI